MKSYYFLLMLSITYFAYPITVTNNTGHKIRFYWQFYGSGGSDLDQNVMELAPGQTASNPRGSGRMLTRYKVALEQPLYSGNWVSYYDKYESRPGKNVTVSLTPQNTLQVIDA